MSIFTQEKYENFPVWAIYGMVRFLFMDYRSFLVWSIAHIVFLVAEEILDQREVRDRVGGAINLGGVRTAMRKFRGYGCRKVTPEVVGKRLQPALLQGFG